MGITGNQVSYARVLQVLRERGAASRADICRSTGLSPAAVTGITRDLIASGYIRARGMVSVGRGRPAEMLEYDSTSRFAVGIELHDHAVSGVVTDLYARPIRSYRVAPVMDGPEAVLSALEKWTEDVFPGLAPKHCAAIGIAVPGLVNQNTGVVEWTTEFDLPQIPIVEILGARLCRRPSVTNRTYAAALAEAWLGAARDASNMVYIRLGDYIGGAILIDGLPYWGSASSAGSVAHMTVDPNGIPCRCGSRGCLDTVASGRAIARRAREEIKRGRASVLSDRTNSSLDLIDGLMVVNAAHEGDALAVDLLREAAEWLGVAVSVIINLLGPDTLVIGGHIGRNAGEEFLGWMRAAATRRAYALPMHNVRIVSSLLGEDAVACGAAATALWSGLTQSINLHVA